MTDHIKKRSRPKRTFIIFMALLAVAAFFAIWRTFFAVPSYRVAEVHTGKLVAAVYATAIVEPVDWAAIAPADTGRVIEINVEEGDAVEAGTVLARLDDAAVRAQLTEEEALEEYYARKVSRSEALLGTGSVAEEEYEEDRSNLSRTRARIHRLEEQIRQLALIAPVTGIVLWRDVELGEVKTSDDPVFWVGKPRPLRLEAEVDEEDIPKIAPGQKVLITADAYPDQVLTGTVNWISPKGDPVSKSYRVYMALPDDTPLMIGMTVETNTIISEKENALLLPLEAFTPGDTGRGVSGKAVWQLVSTPEGDVAKRTVVKTGLASDEQVEIIDGLEAGDHVLLPPFEGLAEGRKVQGRR